MYNFNQFRTLSIKKMSHESLSSLVYSHELEFIMATMQRLINYLEKPSEQTTMPSL